MNEIVLSVPQITCDHCVRAIREEVGAVAGVRAVEVDLGAKTVRVSGDADPAAVREAIGEAGYQAA
jgi:copper ion binding protein